jgi:hypothetical protein
MTYDELKKELDRRIERRYRLQQERLDRVMERSEELNQGLEPTVDDMGRLHAPRDGYIFLDINGREEAYAGGEFLPMVEETTGMQSNDYKKRKLGLPSDLHTEMMNLGFSDPNFSDPLIGSIVWYGERYTAPNGVELVDVGLKSTRWVYDNLLDILDIDERRRIDAGEVTPKGQAWNGNKLTARGRIVAAFLKKNPFAYGQMDLRVIIELDDRSTAIGNFPRSKLEKFGIGYMAEKQLKGAEITFIANFKPFQHNILNDETGDFEVTVDGRFAKEDDPYTSWFTYMKVQDIKIFNSIKEEVEA